MAPWEDHEIHYKQVVAPLPCEFSGVSMRLISLPGPARFPKDLEP